MGCLQSKKESADIHPNVFRVVNIDENGDDLCSGQLEITESDIILYREGRDSTIWPLHSLRRYGFEQEVFSFESGRRCETGEGIYAFRCRRASILFHSLQQQIQLRNVIHDTMPYPVSRLSPSAQTRPTLQASVIHRSSIDNGQPELPHGPMVNSNVPHSGARHATQSPRSPSSADILEVMPLYPRTQANGSHVTNIYQLREVKREHNNNTQAEASNAQHVYSNDLNRDLAILRNNLRHESVLNTIRDIEDETLFLERRYINASEPTRTSNNPISPTLSNISEHYAQLNIEQKETVWQQESARLYMNILPNMPTENNFTETHKNDTAPTTPLTPKPVEYCNLTIGAKEINTYANLALGDLGESIKYAKSIFPATSDNFSKYSEFDAFNSMSPVEELEVNYAVLDIDSNKEQTKATRELVSPELRSLNGSRNGSTPSCSSQPRSRLVSQDSLETSTNTTSTAPSSSTIGYTTIDFDKTVALTSVAAGTDIDDDGQRKTRHDSCNVFCGSPGSADKKINKYIEN